MKQVDCLLASFVLVELCSPYIGSGTHTFEHVGTNFGWTALQSAMSSLAAPHDDPVVHTNTADDPVVDLLLDCMH